MLPRERFGPDELLIWLEDTQLRNERARHSHQRRRYACRKGRSEPPHSKRVVVVLVGVAPFNRDSGTLRGKRTVWGGRARVCTALYMGAMVASRFNPVIRDFYQRLLSAGKPKKLALTACKRKLLIILNSMLKYGSSWNHPAIKSLTHSH